MQQQEENTLMQEQEEEMRMLQETFPSLLPLFAPLPQAYMMWLLRQTPKALFNIMHLPDSPLSLEQMIWQQFLQQRALVLFYLRPLTQQKLTKTWVQQSVVAFDPNIPQQRKVPHMNTIDGWRSRGILRFAGYGHAELQSLSALLIMRSLNYQQRDWLPGSVFAGEPFFWLYGLLPGQQEKKVYSVPLPPDLPEHLLLYSPWAGASWTLPGWMSLGPYGAIGWAGVTPAGRYTLSETQLRQWKAETGSLQSPFGHPFPHFAIPQPLLEEDYREDRCHRLASELLPQVGETLLKSFFLTDWPHAPVPGDLALLRQHLF